MAWKEFKREDKGNSLGVPCISLTKLHFRLNSAFIKAYKIAHPCFVTIYINEEDKQIGFKFHVKEETNAYKVTFYPRNRKTKAYNGQFGAIRIMQEYSWIQKTENEIFEKRRFKPIKKNDMWIIDFKEETNL